MILLTLIILTNIFLVYNINKLLKDSFFSKNYNVKFISLINDIKNNVNKK